MVVNILQHDIVWANPTENRKRLEQQLLQLPKADLYVLTEMFSTGFATEPAGIAETDGASMEWMRHMAAMLDAAIAGSVATEKDGHFYNRFYFVEPDGKVTYYDKHHLFTYSGEDKQFTRGNKRVVVEYKGVRFLLQVCYDLRFPVFSRNKGDYDAIIFVANWPSTRIEAWKTLLRARAIENQCYVIGVNRVGKDPKCEYPGGSAIIDPYGRTLTASEDYQETSATSIIDMDTLQAFREKFPVGDDADRFVLYANEE
ncbi:MAG: amidohydrolase [Bacteroidaceae bacterium]|nr:amidohydrolase [Bacteroidaceae bacterium]